MSFHDDMNEISRYNKTLLTPALAFVLAVFVGLIYFYYQWSNYDIPLTTRLLFVFSGVSFLVSLYTIFSQKRKSLLNKRYEWKLEREREEIEIKERSLKKKSEELDSKINWIESQNHALEKKRKEYVVFDFQ